LFIKVVYVPERINESQSRQVIYYIALGSPCTHVIYSDKLNNTCSEGKKKIITAVSVYVIYFIINEKQRGVGHYSGWVTVLEGIAQRFILNLITFHIAINRCSQKLRF